MVGRWGMSDEIGPLAVTNGREDGLLLPGAVVASPATQERVDREVQRIVESAEEEVVDLLTTERARLDALARALLERETLDQSDAYRVAGVEALDAAESRHMQAKAAPGPIIER
jgi:cell division protease FtsH